MSATHPPTVAGPVRHDTRPRGRPRGGTLPGTVPAHATGACPSYASSTRCPYLQPAGGGGASERGPSVGEAVGEHVSGDRPPPKRASLLRVEEARLSADGADGGGQSKQRQSILSGTEAEQKDRILNNPRGRAGVQPPNRPLGK